MRLVLALAVVGCGGSPSSTIDAEPFQRVAGFTAEYFDQYRVLRETVVEPAIDHVFEGDRFSARYTGVLDVPAAGPHTFAIDADDGTRLWVNGNLVIDDWRGHFVEHHEVTVELPAGEVDIRLDYFELDLDASLKLAWTPATPVVTAPPIEGAPKPPYENPVVANDCPDPGVLATGTPPTYYAICTGGRFRIRRSHDLVMWENTDAFVFPSGKPPYAANGDRNWAPEMHEVGGKFLVYYTSVNAADVLSIGVASSSSPLGPYVDRGSPLVEHPQGVIDATYVAAGGKHYLAYKIDGNSVGEPTPIYLRELAADGMAFAAGSAQVEILRNAPGTWEGGVAEAPWIVEHGGMFYLFYSGNVYDARYRTGVARATSIAGPYTKYAGNPILKNDATWVGPGHGSVVAVGAKHYFVYHAWRNDGAGGNDVPKGRQILVDEIVWADGWPRIGNGTPSDTPRPWPGEAN
ncbi:MAG TPA: family 43 glycosylhydrolase [Kofleriaceae bacterium]